MSWLRKSMCAVGAAAALSFAIPAMASLGDTFVLPIEKTQGGTFTDLAGGFNGDRTVAHSGQAGDISRVYWLVPNSVDPSPQLYKISWWASPGSETNAFQPFEVQYNGTAGDSAGIDPNIPWHGQFGTNHQYISNNYTTTSAFNLTGPGPQTPGDVSDTGVGSPANPPGLDGTEVWLKPGSELFVKWDFAFYAPGTTNVVSDLQITQAPEPASLSVLLIGAGCLTMRRRRNASMK